MPVITNCNINLKTTLESGQFFRFVQDNDKFQVYFDDKETVVWQKESKLFFKNNTRKKVSDFFRLDDDITYMRKEISKDPKLRKMTAQIQGLGLLRQDPWNCSIAFLLSSASNIPRITKCVNNLAMISNEQLKDEKVLRKLGCGFRAKYISNFASTTTPDKMRHLRKLSYLDAKNKLMEFNGIGEKVADCISLFSLDNLNAFPIDTWIEKAMKYHYFNNKPIKHCSIQEFANEKFGSLAGFAQQYIYHYSRVNNHLYK